MKRIFLMIFLFTICDLFSQNEEEIRNLILQKKYYTADSLLKKTILKQESVSSEITFLFGKN